MYGDPAQHTKSCTQCGEYLTPAILLALINDLLVFCIRNPIGEPATMLPSQHATYYCDVYSGDPHRMEHPCGSPNCCILNSAYEQCKRSIYLVLDCTSTKQDYQLHNM